MWYEKRMKYTFHFHPVRIASQCQRRRRHFWVEHEKKKFYGRKAIYLKGFGLTNEKKKTTYKIDTDLLLPELS